MNMINQFKNEDKLLEFIYNDRVEEFQKYVDDIIISNKLSDYTTYNSKNQTHRN